jgi:exopolysaccharide biosynthesis operon protein EpsL
MEVDISWLARRMGRTTLVGLVCLLPFAAGADQGDTINFAVATGITHDDNVFRLSPETDPVLAIGSPRRDDTTTSASASMAIDKTVRRQRFKLDTRLDSIRYQRFRMLDHELSEIKAAWLWQFGNRLHGEWSAARKQALTGFSDFRSPQKSINTTESGYGSLYLMVGADWEWFATASGSSVGNSDPARASSDSRSDTVETGLRYTPPSGNRLGLSLRRVDARYPNLQLAAGSRVDNSFRQDDLDADVSWQFSAAGRFTGRIGHSRRRHDDVPVRDYSGPTGRFALDWQPSARTSLNLSARRELGGTSDDLANYVVSRAVSISPAFAPTARTRFQLSLERARRSYGGDPGFILGTLPKREDDVRGASLSATYTPHRALVLSLSRRDERRDSNYAGLPYRDRTTYLSAQFSF